MSVLRTLAIVCLMTVGASAQSQQPADSQAVPCSAPEASQFDFWVGAWDVTWADSGHGTNTITKPLGQCVIEEHFADLDTNSLKGMSVSVYDPRHKQWQQTWVDNQGGYMVFTGGFADGKMILSRKATRPDGKEVVQRMVWHDITADSLIWDWQASEDNGTTWKTNWQILYKRHK